MLSVLILTALLIGTTVSAEWVPPEGGMRIILTDENGKMLRGGFSGDYEIQVQIDVATPSGIKTLGHYRIKRSGFWKFDTTRSVLKVEDIRKFLSSISEEKRYGIRVSVWVIDRENGQLYMGGIGSDFLSAEDLRGGATKRVSVELLEKEPLPKPARERWYYYEWRPADDSWEAEEYVKVPILIIDNRNGKGGSSRGGPCLWKHRTRRSSQRPSPTGLTLRKSSEVETQ
ncbi:hypothetical protein [Thermococcus sp. JCM 11816]|uniref:hypothetical protein n=1 Tax=Thermococcus sp. (strain JCM 11816 / KS-1) TaxID=1295125 RepID=UPI000B196B83